MNRIINDISINIRIAVLGLIPLTALLGLGISDLLAEWSKVRKASSIVEVIEVAPSISLLVHELQKERGTSAGFIGSKGKKFAGTIGKRRSDTDKALKSFKTTLASVAGQIKSKGFQADLTKAQSALSELNAKRKSIDKFSINVVQMAGYYTPLIANLLSSVENVGASATDQSLIHSFTAYTAFLQGKERAGLERAMGAVGFGAGEYKAEIFRKYVRFVAMQDTFFGMFRRFATQEQNDAFKAKLQGTVQGDVTHMRKLTYANPFGGDISSVTGAEWFAASTKRIDALKSIEDKIADDIISMAKATANASIQKLLWLAAGLLILLILIASLSIVIARSIIIPIKRLTDNIGVLAKNDTSVLPEGQDRQDEIGAMARAVEVFRNVIIKNEELRAENDSQKTKAKLDLEVRSIAQMAMMLESVNNTALNLSKLDSHSLQVSRSGQTIATAADELVTSVEEISRNSVDVSESAKETEQTVSQGRDSAQNANSAIQEISRSVESSVVSLDKLTEASDHISQILNVIEDIAEQTNLLALNATIEAARAGEAGKGFAVVAAEVKGLANQTTKATEDISERIAALKSGMDDITETLNRSREAVNGGTALIEETTITMDQASVQVSKVTEKMLEITGILEQQQTASAEIAESITEVANLAEESKAQVHSISGLITSSNDLMTEQANDIYQSDSDRSLCEMAKIDHVLFKKRVMDAVMGRVELHSSDIPDHHTCRLGKWYDAITQANITDMPSFKEMVEPHKLVHAAAKRALDAYDSGQSDVAMQALQEMNDAGSSVIRILNQLSDALLELENNSIQINNAA